MWPPSGGPRQRRRLTTQIDHVTSFLRAVEDVGHRDFGKPDTDGGVHCVRLSEIYGRLEHHQQPRHQTLHGLGRLGRCGADLASI